MLSNCGSGEDSWEFLEMQGDQTSQSYKKSTLSIHWKDWWANTLAHLMRRAYSLEKTLMLAKIEGKRRRGQQKIRWLENITDSMAVNLSKLQETVKEESGMLQLVGSRKFGRDLATGWQYHEDNG